MLFSLPVLTAVRTSTRGAFLLMVCGTIFLAGCGGGGQPASVTGQVTFDGTAVESGAIRFDAMGDTQSAPASAKVISGRYEIPQTAGLIAGNYRVSITASESVGKQIEPETGEEVEVSRSLIPEKYNLMTELTAELSQGQNQKDFELLP